ncbi:hypothetical protein VKT23_014396 [Stygiomarasmius scandens]|uniref:Uncharacterized protein n=1 Tax=Marasmiellus scandens TaxID=2682957 RepID=A0ABR1J2Z2_9AGAR
MPPITVPSPRQLDGLGRYPRPEKRNRVLETTPANGAEAEAEAEAGEEEDMETHLVELAMSLQHSEVEATIEAATTEAATCRMIITET